MKVISFCIPNIDLMLFLVLGVAVPVSAYSDTTLVQGLILFVVRHFGQLDLRSFGAFRVTLSCDVMFEFKVI
jgi:hypothetical protein